MKHIFCFSDLHLDTYRIFRMRVHGAELIGSAFFYFKGAVISGKNLFHAV